MAPNEGATWVYESLVGAIPGIEVSDRVAIAIQLLIFESAVVAVAAIYGLWQGFVAGSVAVIVAGVGSWLMLTYSRAVRRASAPQPYRRLLFGSSIDVALSVFAFVLLVTFLFVVDPRSGGSTLLTELLGSEPPIVAVVLLLVISWDVVYRIGTCWWATVVGFWRSMQYRFDPDETRQYVWIDARNVGFAGVQLLLVPLVIDYPLLVVALVGHVVAVVLVASGSILLQGQKTLR